MMSSRPHTSRRHRRVGTLKYRPSFVPSLKSQFLSSLQNRRCHYFRLIFSFSLPRGLFYFCRQTGPNQRLNPIH